MTPHHSLSDALKHHFGFDTFKGHQEAIIRSLLEGHDTFVLMPTGGGKSLCYQLPALLSEGTAIVISPLIALMKNQVDAMRHFSEADHIAHFLNSSLNKAEAERVKADVCSGRTKLLYVAPESLTKEENIEFLRGVPISFYAVDEAHCISEWGHDFRPEYRRIRPIINEISPRPVIALTATATPKVQHDIQRNLGMTDARVFKSSFNRPNLYYEVRQKTSSIDKDIIRYAKQNEGKSGIIYCLSRRRVEMLAELLRINDIRALPYHAGLDPSTRAANQDAFLLEKVDIIVATIAFGMGIDKPDVRFVIHYDIPKSLEGYYQETGRAGRDGLEGRCITFYSSRDLQKMEKFIQSKPMTEQEIGRQLLCETAAYAESSVCRRKSLLHYFGEEYSGDNCGNCDNCLNPPTASDATEEMEAILATVDALHEPFKPEHIAAIIRGQVTSDIKSYRHDSLDTFGSMPDADARWLLAVIRQGVIEGLLSRDMESFGKVRLTSKGVEFMKHPAKFKAVRDREYQSDDDGEADPIKGGAGGAADTQLFAILRDLCRETARRLDLPPYVIFQEPSLEAMATTYPVTLEELAAIPGVGMGKARRYGQTFVDVIARYVEDYEIERPEDMVVRTMANKSKQKIAVIQSIDRKIPLDEIALAHSLKFSDLLDEIEAIVMAGTKINIAYHINNILDEEQQAELFDYFRHSDTGSLEDAYSELCPDYTEDEIRMIRIRFLSEMGN